jgi:hypothetical protein
LTQSQTWSPAYIYSSRRRRPQLSNHVFNAYEIYHAMASFCNLGGIEVESFVPFEPQAHGSGTLEFPGAEI